MTRGRADKQTGAVKDIHAIYYGERASAGLQFTEGTLISRQGHGWSGAPDIYSKEQIEAWQAVTAAVHKANGVIFCQLAHSGRACHSDVTGHPIVSASAIPVSGEATGLNHEKKPYEVPRALTVEEIAVIVGDFATAAKNSIEAGFDGVQLHSANGFLIGQFTQSCSNQRTDGRVRRLDREPSSLLQGGACRSRRCHRQAACVDPLEPQQAPSMTWARKTTLRPLTLRSSWPHRSRLLGLSCSTALPLGSTRRAPYTLEQARAAIASVDPKSQTALAGNVGYTLETAEKAISEGRADIITFGRPFMSNPDLPERFRDGAVLAPDSQYPDWWVNDTAEGYITFPRATAAA
ncbi:NADH:flavin oxidoreductase, putative [Bodo saltans]|uniref:NADH:flavin oxidoreductase, putative n=1 Tax=Bodo saltans TaxID=75058 RepID=A0A0S4IVY9_BODSA|nr:NADH:flavin oxidoreductase, putative [Bodo saltans]|eukprot:CUG23158.1 NADH:flavin oxidoreductase, putative [Bodo saltans]